MQKRQAWDDERPQGQDRIGNPYPHPHTAAEASLSAAALRIGEQGRQGRGRMNSTSTEHHPDPPRAPSTDLMAALAAHWLATPVLRPKMLTATPRLCSWFMVRGLTAALVTLPARGYKATCSPPF
jgi:hypothetical protein